MLSCEARFGGHTIFAEKGNIMLKTNRRKTLKLLGGAALTATALPVLSHQAIAQDDLVVPNTLENFKRGTIHSMHPEQRSFTIIWEDLGRVKIKAADLVTNWGSLKVGQIVDVHWYDYMDFLVAKKTPATSARAAAMKDPAWQAYLAKGPAKLQEMHSTLLLPTNYSPLK